MHRYVLPILIVVSALSVPVRSGVTGYKVYADSTIKQLRGGTVEQTEHIAKGYPTTVDQTPVEARTMLVDQSNDPPHYSGLNRVVSNAPQFNEALPTDFILEVAAGSAESDVSLVTNSVARQTRSIEVLSTDFDPPALPGQNLNLQSTFLLDGGMAAVVPLSTSSAEGLSLSLNLSIYQDETQLLERTLSMTGLADGTVDVAAGGFAPTEYSVLPITLPDLATAWLVAFNDLSIPFAYPAVVGDTFELEARIAVDATIPGGLGGGAAFGTLPTEMLIVAEELFGQTIDVPTKVAEPDFTPMAAAPEPTTLALIAMGACAVIGRRK